jgi:hypothetical protein
MNSSSVDSIQRSAADHYTRARYYDFDPDFLIEMEPTVRHYNLHSAPTLVTAMRPAPNSRYCARYLNTSESTVEKWETGAKKPSGMALKLLAVVQKHGLMMLA